MAQRPRRKLLYALVVTVVLGAPLFILLPRVFQSCRTHAGADRRIASLHADPIVAFTPPGTVLEGRTDDKGKDCTTMGQRTSDPSTVSLHYSVTAEPASVVEAYRNAAQAVGWQLRLVACSRPARSMRVLLDKSVGGSAAQLLVEGSDPYPPGRRSLTVRLGSMGLGSDPRPDETGGDLRCVRPVQAGDPELRPFSATPTRQPAELCALLPIGLLQNEGIGVTGAIPERDDRVPVCRYDFSFFLRLRDVSTEAKALYQDRRLPTPSPGGDGLFFVTDGAGSVRIGAWIDAPGGPLLLEAPAQTDDVVLRVAKSVQDRAAAPAAPPSAPPRTSPCPPGVRC